HRPLQELQIPRHSRPADRGRGQQGQRPQAHDRSRHASRRWPTGDEISLARCHQFRAHHTRARITYDATFENWAQTVFNVEGDAGMSLKNYKKNMTIELYNLQGVKVRAWNVYRCWVSEFTAVPELDANGNAIAFESIIVQNEGFERDVAVVETAEF